MDIAAETPQSASLTEKANANSIVSGLKACDIKKFFSGVAALSGVSLQISPGEIVGLVGHNGAGKSTLLKVLAGAHAADEGEILVDGKKERYSSPADALKAGVATVYQELALLPNLTVTQNAWLGREVTSLGKIQKEKMSTATRELMQNFGLDIDVDAQVGDYPVATRQLLEIAIATSKDINYLLLDEPTTALEGEQIVKLLQYVKELAKTKNIGVLMVNHKLDELYEICDRIVALVDGQVVIDGSAKDVSHEQVVATIAGEDALDLINQMEDTQDKSAELPSDENNKPYAEVENETILEVKDLKSDTLSGVNLSIKAGEVLGIYGLVGSGRTEFLRALAGIEKVHSGEISYLGKKYWPTKPKVALENRIIYVTEERKHDGIVPQLSGVVNAGLANLQKYRKSGWLSLRKLDREMSELLKDLKLKGDSHNPVVSLSGGNQQKVLLARAISQNPKVLMLDEPTKGVDIGVKTEIHRIFQKMAHEQGIAVLVVSSEEEEVLEVSDKICVFSSGRNISEPVDASTMNISSLRREAWQHS